MDKLNFVVSSLKKRSSPGYDQVNNRIISRPPFDYRSLLLSILNNLFSEDLFPESWKTSIVYIIPKSSPGKFRPISLTSCILKLLEKLILQRLDWWLEERQKLPDFQYEFRRRKSCLDNLSILSTEIHTSFVRGQVTACLFLDLSNTFDDVIPHLLPLN